MASSEHGDSPVQHGLSRICSAMPMFFDMTYEELLASVEPVTPDEPQETDLAVLMYTGGATGLPKGVAIEHRAECSTCTTLR